MGRLFNKYLKAVFLCILLVVYSVDSGKAQNEKLKGVQIFKTALNTNWPPQGQTFVIGIYGESSVYFVLSAISRARKIGNKAVFVKKLNNKEQSAECNIVFVTNQKQSDLADIKSLTSDKDVLIITEESNQTSNFNVNLVSNANAVTYELNKSNVSKGISFSEKLVSEAAKIY